MQVLTISYIVLCIWCSLYQVYCVTIPDYIFNHFDDSEYRTCQEYNVFRLFFHISFKDCVDECHLRTRCHVIMYHGPSLQMCGLMSAIDINALSNQIPLCYFANVGNWTKRHLKACSENTCNETTRCTLNDDGSHKICVASECLDPPVIPQATLLSRMWTVGKKNAYRCNAGYVPVGKSSITCEETGIWSSVNFTCRLPCPQPRSLDNADIVAIDGENYAEGTVLTLRCKPGYSVPGNLSITSTCGHDRNWTSPVIPCCKTGYSLSQGIYGRYCYKAYLNVPTTSWYDMYQHCQATNSLMSNNRGRLFEDVVSTNQEAFIPSRPIMISFNKSEIIYYYERKNRLALCIDNIMDEYQSGSVDEATIKDYPFDDLVKFVRDESFEGIPDCGFVSEWVHGSLNGQDCVMVDPADNYKYTDVPCVWTEENKYFVCFDEHRVLNNY